jgi:type I restriction enzyme, R subunit
MNERDNENMTQKLTESTIEEFAIHLLERQGYSSLYGPDIAPDGNNPERSHYDDVLLTGRLEAALRRINPRHSPSVLQAALKEVQRVHSPDLLANNEAFHRLLTEGVGVSYQQNGNERGDLVKLIDFDTPENNEFVVANQFTVIENHQNKRPDMVLFVNGIPLVVLELKNAADENATIKSAFRQIETYKQAIPALFTANAIVVISDGLEARAGSLSAGFSRFMAWKSADGKAEASHLVSQLETLISGMLNKATLLDLVRHFIVFEKSKKEDPLTGIVTITTVKKLAAYHQYYAVNAAVASTLRAVDLDAHLQALENPLSYGLPGVGGQPRGDMKAGVVWHTQGSGKSLSMVFYTGKIVLVLDNPTILVITDRNDLDDQLFDTFAASKQLLR